MAIPDQLEQFRENRIIAEQMMHTLGKDCRDHFQALCEDDSQIHRRAYVRAVFAFIESMVYRLKRTTANLALLFGKLTLYELVALDDVKLHVDQKGKVVTQTAYPHFLNNIKFAFKAYSKSLGSTFELYIKGEGWENLQSAVKIRDRLMHPKEEKDLTVNDIEVSSTKVAFEWFFRSYHLCGLHAEMAMKVASNEKVDELQARIDQLEVELKRSS